MLWYFEQGTACLACVWEIHVRLSNGGDAYSPLSMSHSDCRQVVEQAHVHQLVKPSIRCKVMRSMHATFAVQLDLLSCSSQSRNSLHLQMHLLTLGSNCRSL